MSQKVWGTLTIIAVILGVLNLTLLVSPNLLGSFLFQSDLHDPSQKTSLRIGQIAIQNTSDYYVIRVSLFLPNEIRTLFNCRIQVDYFTKNSVWKTVSLDIGLVNYEDVNLHNLRMDADFLSEITLRHGPGTNYILYEGPNVKVEAYGYLKP